MTPLAPTWMLSLGQLLVKSLLALLIALILYIVWPKEPNRAAAEPEERDSKPISLTKEKCFIFDSPPLLHLTDFLPTKLPESRDLLVYPIRIPSNNLSRASRSLSRSGSRGRSRSRGRGRGRSWSRSRSQSVERNSPKRARAESLRAVEREKQIEHENLLQESREAHDLGDHDLARALSSQANDVQAEQNAASSEASTLFYELNNEDRGRPANEVDLHGQRRNEAISIAKRRLHDVKEGVHDELVFITGWGRHSPGNRPVLLPAVLGECRRWSSSITCEPATDFDGPNPGCILVRRKEQADICDSENSSNNNNTTTTTTTTNTFSETSDSQPLDSNSDDDDID